MEADRWERLARCEGFGRDDANALKIWERHEVAPGDAEQLFFNQPRVAATDSGPSDDEPRFHALGQSDTGRRLFVVFTFRRKHLRVISARDVSRRERKEYDDAP